jgi:hypothetical protein
MEIDVIHGPVLVGSGMKTDDAQWSLNLLPGVSAGMRRDRFHISSEFLRAMVDTAISICYISSGLHNVFLPAFGIAPIKSDAFSPKASLALQVVSGCLEKVCPDVTAGIAGKLLSSR